MPLKDKAGEIEALLKAEHSDPFHILGPHRVTVDGGAAVAVRAIAPLAKEAYVVIGEEVRPMERVHPGGFFQAVFPGKETLPNYRLRLLFPGGGGEERADPYAFPPFLTDFDLYLLTEGTHLESYQKLGSHPAVIQGVPGITFAVWAPNAARVSVVGDFNGWDGRRHMMRGRGPSGVWELFIPELKAGLLYKYEIRSKALPTPFLKTDPYAFFHEKPPKTASVVWEDAYVWQDADWLAKRARANPFESPLNVYEVHLGSWMRVPEEGNRFLSYGELAGKLIPYALEMGYTHLELMPITEYPFDGSWGYQTVGYYAPTSRFGTPADFKAFVDACHRAGLGVILDWVPSHFPTDAHGLARFDGTALYEHADPRQGFHPDWNTLIFNFGRSEVRNFLLSNALFWFKECHLDGLRVDAVASMLYLDYSRKPGQWIPNVHGGRENLEAIEFLKEFNTIVHRECPGVLTIAEESTSWPGVSRPVHAGGLGFSMKWNMGWMHDVLRYMSKQSVHRKFHHYEATFSLLYAYTENFMLPLSHDEVVHGKASLLSKMPGDDWQKFASLRALFGFMGGHPGKKLLFMGCEFGQWREWNHDASLDWDLLRYSPHQGLRRWVQDLNKLVAAEPALHQLDFDPAGFEWIDCHDSDASVFTFLRLARERREFVAAAVNLTPVERTGYRIGVPEPGFYRELANSDSGFYGGGNRGNSGGVWAEPLPWHGRPHSLSLTLPPLSALFFKVKR